MKAVRIIKHKQVLFLIIIAVLTSQLILKMPNELMILAAAVAIVFVVSTLKNITNGYLFVLFFFTSAIMNYIPHEENLSPSVFLEAVIIFVFIINLFLKKVKLPAFNYQTKAILLFFSICLVSAMWAGTFSLKIFKTIFVVVFLYLLTLSLVNNFKVSNHVFRVLVLSGLTHAIEVMSKLYRGQLEEVESLRVGSDFLNANSVAGFLVMLIPAAMYLLKYDKNQLWRVIAFISIPIYLVAIVYGRSRSGFIVLILCLLMLIYFFKDYKIRLFSVGVIICFLIFAPLFYWERIETINTDPTYGGRRILFENAIDIIKESPLTGKGYGGVVEREIIFRTGKIAGDPHNLYLGIAASIGIISLLLYLSVFAKTIYDIRLLMRKSDNYRNKKAFLKSIEISIYVFLMFSFSGDTLMKPLIYVYIALILAMHKFITEDDKLKNQ